MVTMIQEHVGYCGIPDGTGDVMRAAVIIERSYGSQMYRWMAYDLADGKDITSGPWMMNLDDAKWSAVALIEDPTRSVSLSPIDLCV